MAINLSKGQKINLAKSDGNALSAIRLGLGWDPIKTRGFFGFTKEKAVDLDASVIFYSGNQAVDIVFYGKLNDPANSVFHHGDNLTGQGDGDDEIIDVNLAAVPVQVTSLALVITSYSQDRFDNIENAFVRVEDVSTRSEIARFTVSDKGSHTGLLVAVLSRGPQGWEFKASGAPLLGAARTPRDVIQTVATML